MKEYKNSDEFLRAREFMKITIDYKLSNWNEVVNDNRRNRYLGAKNKKKEMQTIRAFLLNTPKIESYPVKITCYWHVKNANGDLDNKCIKAVLDEMQELGILENDNIKHISEITYKAVKDSRDFLEIEINPI